ncbi:hypothetical protein ABGB16_20820 [Micromonospora sp. B11E3]|uniref:hypothetical protein n=1 Tax=Micromonospora sp. B11E3 TaxID=3153562 RepID=UPI00325CCB4A
MPASTPPTSANRRCATWANGSTGGGATSGRHTDPIGGPVFGHDPAEWSSRGAPAAASVDVRLRDPRAVTIDPADTVPPPVERHWPYHTDPQYQAAVQELVDRTR